MSLPLLYQYQAKVMIMIQKNYLRKIKMKIQVLNIKKDMNTTKKNMKENLIISNLIKSKFYN
jgi:hypothetical protein